VAKKFESEIEEVNGQFTLLYNEERRDLYRITNAVRTAKLRRSRAGFVPLMSRKMHSEY
jgi:hypothetical protein